MARAVWAVIEDSSRCRYENGAALECASVYGFEHLVNLAERVLFDKRRNLDATVQHEFQGIGIKFGRTSPVSNRPRVIGHQVRESYLDLVHGESDNGKRGAVIEQAECRLLPDAGARTFENDPLGLAQAAFLGEGLDRRFDVARRHLFRVQRERGALPL